MTDCICPGCGNEHEIDDENTIDDEHDSDDEEDSQASAPITND